MVDVGSEKSFERATRQFAEQYGWEVGRGTLLNRTEQAAEMAEQDVEARLHQGADTAITPFPSEGADTAITPFPSERVETMVVELDGCEIRTGQMMTAGEAGRADLPGHCAGRWWPRIEGRIGTPFSDVSIYPGSSPSRGT